MDLASWLKNFLRMKDQIDRKLKDIKEAPGKMIAVYDDKTTIFLVAERLEEKMVEAARKKECQGLCVKNTEDNFRFLISHWKEFSTVPGFVIIFVNLDLEEKWILYPYTHDSIADPDSLEQGLRSMFDLANGKVSEPLKQKKRKIFEESEENEENEE